MTNFIEDTLQQSRILSGREASPDEMATEFAKMDPTKRMQVLASIEKEGGDLTIRGAAKTLRHERALRSMHERLRSIDR